MRFHFRILAFFSTLLILQGCWSDYSWNQKITIVVDTPDGIKTSSAITRVERESNFFIHYFFKDGSPPKYIYKQFGEAAFVELGDGKYLFALLPYSSRSGRLARSLYRSNLNWYTSMDDLVDLPPKTLSIEQYPMLVAFADINDPGSIQQVDIDDLDNSFKYEANSNEAKQWRTFGNTWQRWYRIEEAARAGYEAAAMQGLTSELADAVVKTKIARYFRDWLKDSPHPPYDLKTGSKEYKRLIDFRNSHKYGSREWNNIVDDVIKSTKTARRDTSKDCYSIKSITIEITDQPINGARIFDVLPWLDDIWPKSLDSKPFDHSKPRSFASRISSRNFSTFRKK